MRIANKTMYDNIRINLDRATEEMVRASNVVSSGKRINKLSDDPIGLVNVLDLRASLENVRQLERNISVGKSWLQAGESALSQVHSILSETKALCIQMANATQGATERANAAVQVDGYIRQILALANSQVGGRYIFGGTDTATTPFDLDESGTVAQVNYNGNGTPFAIRIGKDQDVEIGRDGEEIFGDHNFDWSDPAAGSGNIFKGLLDLKSALESNDIDGIETAIGRLDTYMDRINDFISDTGIKETQLEVKGDIIAELKLNYQDRKSKLEDADIAQAVMDLTTKQTAYKAALASSAKVMQLSLVDFL
ncbi:MAG: flagellar hook-associated protein 3 [Deltaproteobacteria bacterium]|nr:MAG: flagellar hook-associated protein 3 [Deltaproteobacteria bacterium]RLB86276.1 MAG: flagellar hook-associated protein 3 [Deltaproteobacteria bacterium]